MKVFTVLSVVIFLLFQSCKSSKPTAKVQVDEVLHEIQGTIVFNPRTGHYDTVYVRNSKLDTLERKKPSRYVPASIGAKSQNLQKAVVEQSTKFSKKSDEAELSELNSPISGKLTSNSVDKSKSKFRIAFLLPFFTDKFANSDNDLYEKSKWALQFYAGARLALDSLQADGIQLDVEVHDTKANELQLKQLLQLESIRNADVLIGAETNANVKLAADFAQKNKKILISPYNPVSELVRNNPQFIQINPSLRTNCEAIMRHVRKTFSAEEIVLICRDKNNEREALQYLQLENRRLSPGSSAKVRECIIDEKGGLASFDPKSIMGKENTVIIVPVWGQNSETFVYSLLSKINGVKAKKNVTVYGMPQWSAFQVNVYDVFEPLQVHITQPIFVDKFSEEALSFSNSFFKVYQTAPSDEAFVGYDVTLYCGKMLQKYGTSFNEFAPLLPYKGLHTRFVFERESDSGPLPVGQNVPFDRITNKFVNVLKFQDGCFEPVD